MAGNTRPLFDTQHVFSGDLPLAMKPPPDRRLRNTQISCHCVLRAVAAACRGECVAFRRGSHAPLLYDIVLIDNTINYHAANTLSYYQPA